MVDSLHGQIATINTPQTTKMHNKKDLILKVRVSLSDVTGSSTTKYQDYDIGRVIFQYTNGSFHAHR